MRLGKSVFRYLQVSALSFALNLGLTVFLHEICGASEEVAFAAALLVVFCVNFLAMRYYIYAGRQGSLARQAAVYTGSAVGFRLSEYALFLLFHTYLGFDYRAVVVAVIAGAAIAKFAYYRLVFERGALRPDLDPL